MVLSLLILNLSTVSETVKAQSGENLTISERIKQMDPDSLYTGLWVCYPQGYTRQRWRKSHQGL